MCRSYQTFSIVVDSQHRNNFPRTAATAFRFRPGVGVTKVGVVGVRVGIGLVGVVVMLDKVNNVMAKRNEKVKFKPKLQEKRANVHVARLTSLH
jgi:hypothetical protein